MHKFDALILGAGAAGLLCAIEAGKRGRRVAVLERADRIGKKILISGGGRCNFTNLHCRPENFFSANEHFAKSALARYTPADFTALVEKHRIPYHEKTLGQLFCDRAAEDMGNIVALEHVNVRIPSQMTATDFWVTGMGFTRDPYIMTGTNNMWINIGQQHPQNGRNRIRIRSGASIRLEHRLHEARPRALPPRGKGLQVL